MEAAFQNKRFRRENKDDPSAALDYYRMYRTKLIKFNSTLRAILSKDSGRNSMDNIHTILENLSAMQQGMSQRQLELNNKV